jgi:hypothetical protein
MTEMTSITEIESASATTPACHAREGEGTATMDAFLVQCHSLRHSDWAGDGRVLRLKQGTPRTFDDIIRELVGMNVAVLVIDECAVGEYIYKAPARVAAAFAIGTDKACGMEDPRQHSSHRRLTPSI